MPGQNKNNNNGKRNYSIGPPPFEVAYQMPSLQTIQPSEEDIASLQRAALEAYGDHRLTHDQSLVNARKQVNNKTVQANQWLNRTAPGARRWINAAAEVFPGLTQLRTFVPNTTPYERAMHKDPWDRDAASNLVFSALDVIPAGAVYGRSWLSRQLMRRTPQFLRRVSAPATKFLKYMPNKAIRGQVGYWGVPMLLESRNNKQEEGITYNRDYYSDPDYGKYVDDFIRTRFDPDFISHEAQQLINEPYDPYEGLMMRQNAKSKTQVPLKGFTITSK